MRPAAGLLLLAGCWSAPPPTTQIHAVLPYPGASAEEAEMGMGLKAEEALAGLEGLQRLVLVCEPGLCTARSTFAGRDAFARIRAVSEALDAVNSFPADAEAHRVFVGTPSTIWLKPGADRAATHEAIGELARLGSGASRLGEPAPDQVWTVDPARLAATELDPASLGPAVDTHLGAGTWKGGETLLAEGVPLKRIADPAAASDPGGAFVDGVPAAALGVSRGGAPEGWVPFSGRTTCVFGQRRPSDRALASGLWVHDGSAWRGRTDAPVAPEPGLQAWPCEAGVTPLALVATGPDVDLDLAVRDLQGWSGVQALLVLPPRNLEPVMSLEIDRAKVAALGMSTLEVARAVSWSGEERWRAGGPRVRLELPEGPKSLGDVVLVAKAGERVPLSSVADIHVSLVPSARVRVDGHRAATVAVALTSGTDWRSWTPPEGIQVLPVEDVPTGFP